MGIRFAPSSVRFLDAQSHNVRSKLINDIVWLNDNHHLNPDDPSLTPFLAPPLVMRQFRDDFHWIIFYLDGDDLIVANIGSLSEAPHLYRPPDR